MKKAKMRGRPRSNNQMVHTAVVLPKNLIERLRRDGDASKRGLSGEIRRRLQLTYTAGELPQDQQTSDLIECVSNLATYLERDLGKWHENQTARTAFVAGLLELLTPEALDRFQSFAERYVIARAPTFKPGMDREEAWRTTLDARSIYEHIMQIQRQLDHREDALKTGSTEAALEPAVRDLEPAMRDMSRHIDDPETVGRTHARLVMAAQREAREAERVRQSE